MNRINYLVRIFIVLISLSLSSCDNEPIDPAINLEDFNNGSDESDNGIFKVNVGSQTFVAQFVTAQKTTSPYVIYEIEGTVMTGEVAKVLKIKIFDNGTNSYFTGTSPEGNAGDAFISYLPSNAVPNAIYTSNDFDGINAVTGQVNITTNDIENRKFSGTFSGIIYLVDNNTNEVTDTKILANGIFKDVIYTEQ
jgi:hypothetical protein